MRFLQIVLLFGLMTIARLAFAQSVVQDGFETGAFASSWGLTSGVVITNSGGANGTARFAKLAVYTASTGRELGARFDAVAAGAGWPDQRRGVLPVGMAVKKAR